jgi:hypothetical protein
VRKKSKYKPKGVRTDNMTWVMSSIKPFREISAGTDLRIKNHDAMDKLRRGVADKADMDVLIGAANMCEGYMRLRAELGKDWSTEIRAGQDALLAVARRGVDSNRFVCKAPELVAINLILEIHDAQLDQSTVQDMEKALEIVEKDQKHGKARSVKEKKDAVSACERVDG